MCGRYSLTRQNHDRFPELHDPEDKVIIPSRFNIAPSQPVAIIRLEGADIDRPIVSDNPLPKREGTLMRWGLIPHFAKEIRTDKPLINARSETVADKPSFRGAFRRRKCLIPTDGFYEWKRGGVSPVPYHICLPDREPFVFAGIWDVWHGPSGEDIFESAAIITKQSQGKMKEIHHRAPVALTSEDYDLWLRPSDPPDRNIFSKLSTELDEKFEMYEVNPYVNNVRNDGEKCIEAATHDQFKLF